MTVQVQTFYPRIEPSIPAEVQRHLQLIYLKLNNHGLAFSQLINTTPALVPKFQPSAGTSGATASAAAVSASRAAAAELEALAPLLRQPVIARAYREIAAAYLIDPGSDFQINCTSGTFTVTLPDATELIGQVFSVKNSGAGAVTLAAAAGQLIDATATKALSQWDNLAVMSTGKGWIIVSIGLSM
jgi:hypothetical protein